FFTDSTRLVSHWKDLEKYKFHPYLSGSVHALPAIVKNARATATNKKYDLYFEKFRKWCIQNYFSYLPASVSSVALFLGGLIQQKVSVSVLEAYFYSINWQHKISLNINPCLDDFLKLILEGGKRTLGKPLNKKEPITKDILLKLVRHYTVEKHNLLFLRTCVLCLLGFSGFLRFSELANIRMCDLDFQSNFLEIKIPKSKTDLYRRGNSVVIAKTRNELCPVFWLRKYIALAGIIEKSDEFLFTAINFMKISGEYKATNKSKSLSYTRCREILRSALKDIGLDSSLYALHSLRSGGVSAAANNKVPDRLPKVHWRWATDRAKDGYIKDSIEQKLLVSLNLGL
ncbi:integrase/recombinase xerD homolog, partial [Mytilus galloprovincialis]|uniref:integrase/recombinase xerD homolog n=1 Tax=Mytilus galloprovincialis TaxID=29158 RepID=UPI003F7C94EE